MLVDGVRQTIKHQLAPRGEPRRARIGSPSHACLAGNLGQEGPAETIILEGSVPGGPPDRARPTAVQERAGARVGVDLTVVSQEVGDASETVASLLADAGALPPAPERDPDAVPALLAERGVDVVTWDGWRAIEAAEAELGRAQGRAAVKIADRAALLRAALHP